MCHTLENSFKSILGRSLYSSVFSITASPNSLRTGDRRDRWRTRRFRCEAYERAGNLKSLNNGHKDDLENWTYPGFWDHILP